MNKVREYNYMWAFVFIIGGIIVLGGCTGQEADQGNVQESHITAQAAIPVGDIFTGGVYQTVSPAVFNEMIASNEYIVLDVRTQEEYDDARITQDPLLIDFYAPDFESKIDALDKDQKYLLYCRSGNRSGKTLTLMEERGFSEVNELSGGISNWSASYPVVQ